MAGLGEACSHVAALTFYLNYDYGYKVKKSFTDEFAYWRAQRKPVTPAKLSNINYQVPSSIIGKNPRRANRKRKLFDGKSVVYQKIDFAAAAVEFLGKLQHILPNCVSLDVVPPFYFQNQIQDASNNTLSSVDDADIPTVSCQSDLPNRIRASTDA